jgi:hypothetical protein
MKEKIQSLIGFPIDEKSYKVDLELQDRYTAYSSESASGLYFKVHLNGAF